MKQIDNILTKEKLKGRPFYTSQPHVVILGAGASKAAFLDGDKNGKSIPLLEDLPDILGAPWKELVTGLNHLI